jgi:hypothetical protein
MSALGPSVHHFNTEFFELILTLFYCLDFKRGIKDAWKLNRVPRMTEHCRAFLWESWGVYSDYRNWRRANKQRRRHIEGNMRQSLQLRAECTTVELVSHYHWFGMPPTSTRFHTMDTLVSTLLKPGTTMFRDISKTTRVSRIPTTTFSKSYFIVPILLQSTSPSRMKKQGGRDINLNIATS